MASPTLPDFISALMAPECYEHDVDQVSLVQTHISLVLLAGSYVYKFKKPVDFGFLDFTSLAKRKYFCEQELLLNSRLCPDIYLNGVTVNRTGDDYSLNGTGEIVEHGIQMVRMPEERMMGKIISDGALTKAHLDGIVDALVPFYEKADQTEKIRSFGMADSVGINVLENFEQTECFVGKGALSRQQFDSIKHYAEHILSKTERFEKRVEAAKIRDCHGDLYSANICLDQKIHIFDCIEFNERFRYADVAADVSFLAMDLDYHGLPDLADYFLKRFARESADPSLLEVTDFYKCYRAYVRGKIGLFTAADPAVAPKVAENCQDQAARYFQLAQTYASSTD